VRKLTSKLTMVIALVVVMVPLVGAAALAADQLIQCKEVPCYGSRNDDKILERIGNGKTDKILPRGGHDLILANKYTNDIDVIRSSKGWDKIKVNDNDRLDHAGGGKGTHDWCFVDARKEAGSGCDKVTVR
jgi:hypothetical protein